MKNISIKSYWLLCLAVLLAGCGAQPTKPTRGTSSTLQTNHFNYEASSLPMRLVVDGDTYYYYLRYGGQMENMRMQDAKFVYSLVVVSPDSDRSQRNFPTLTYTGNDVSAQIYRFDKEKLREREERVDFVTYGNWDQIVEDEVKIADVDFNYVYFVNDGKVVFRKSNEELGIDVSDLNNAFLEPNLKPILEKMIRENVKAE